MQEDDSVLEVEQSPIDSHQSLVPAEVHGTATSEMEAISQNHGDEGAHTLQSIVAVDGFYRALNPETIWLDARHIKIIFGTTGLLTSQAYECRLCEYVKTGPEFIGSADIIPIPNRADDLPETEFANRTPIKILQDHCDRQHKEEVELLCSLPHEELEAMINVLDSI